MRNHPVAMSKMASLYIVAFLVGLSACSSGEQTAADNKDPEEISADKEPTEASTEGQVRDDREFGEDAEAEDDDLPDPEEPPDAPEANRPLAEAEASPPEGEELEVSVDDEGNPESEQFIGMQIEDAIDLADGNGVAWHVATIDGEKSLTSGPDGPHLSLELEQDTVTSAVYMSS